MESEVCLEKMSEAERQRLMKCFVESKVFRGDFLRSLFICLVL
jgi:hypothetical protein